MDKDEILDRLSRGEITKEEAKRLLDECDRPPRGTLYLKVSPKGAVSLYGLQRMPVTLYMEQWLRLLDYGEEIRNFIAKHEYQLKRKGS